MEEMMLRFNGSDKDKQIFEEMRFEYPDSRIRKRFEALWLFANHIKVKDIAVLVQYDYASVRKWIHDYEKGGIETLTTIDSNHPKSELQKYQKSIIKELTEHPPMDSKEAAYRIEKMTGIKRSPQRVRLFMTKLGMKFRKVGAIPAKADLEQQEQFKKNDRVRDFKG
jgi:transposase